MTKEFLGGSDDDDNEMKLVPRICSTGREGAREMGKVGVKVRNMKMDFNTGGTWRWVGQ